MALDQGRAIAIDTAITHAMHGVAEPVFRGGLQVGERRRYYNRPPIAALPNGRPARQDGATVLADFLGSSQCGGDVP